MLEFCGYNFTKDINCLDITPTNIAPLTRLQIQNAIYDHMSATRDVVTDYSEIPPTEWEYLMIMNANFNGNINAGNIDFLIEEISALRVKRRVKGTFDWITLKEIPVASIEDLRFSMVDNINANDVVYEYAFVPVMNTSMEGNYVINEILSKFQGVFICDMDTIYKFYAGIQFGSGEKVQKIGVFEPYGRQYPIVVSNALTNYYKGSLSGTVLPPNYIEERTIDREEITKQKNKLLEFLTKKKSKVIKDWNGNIILCFVVDSPTVSYSSNYGGGIANVGFNYTEIGNYYSGQDLYKTGMIDGAT